METKEKDFDCVEFQRQAGLRIHEEVKGKPREERLEYWRVKNEMFWAKFPNMRPPIDTDASTGS